MEHTEAREERIYIRRLRALYVKLCTHGMNTSSARFRHVAPIRSVSVLFPELKSEWAKWNEGVLF